MKARRTGERKVKHQQARYKRDLIPHNAMQLESKIASGDSLGISHRFDGAWSKRNLEARDLIFSLKAPPMRQTQDNRTMATWLLLRIDTSWSSDVGRAVAVMAAGAVAPIFPMHRLFGGFAQGKTNS